MCLLERRIIYPTVNFTKETSYSDIIKTVVQINAVVSGKRKIPGLSASTATGSCWEQKTKLQISYNNLMRWVYTVYEKIGGTANIRLSKMANEQYEMILELSKGSDRSIMQSENPHIIFSDGYNNLLSFSYATDISNKKNFAQKSARFLGRIVLFYKVSNYLLSLIATCAAVRLMQNSMGNGNPFPKPSLSFLNSSLSCYQQKREIN